MYLECLHQEQDHAAMIVARLFVECFAEHGAVRVDAPLNGPVGARCVRQETCLTKTMMTMMMMTETRRRRNRARLTNAGGQCCGIDAFVAEQLAERVQRKVETEHGGQTEAYEINRFEQDLLRREDDVEVAQRNVTKRFNVNGRLVTVYRAGESKI